MASEFMNILTIILLILIIFSLTFLIYRKFSKKDQNKQNNEMNFEKLKNNPPALINSLFANGISRKVGEINIDSFYLTLLDLINKNYVSIKLITKKDKKHGEKNTLGIFESGKDNSKSGLNSYKTLDKIILKINNHSTKNLHPFEKNILRCIHSLESNGNIDLLNIKKAISKRLKVNTFQKNYDAWMKNFHEEYFKSSEIKYFDNKFAEIFKVYGLALIIIFIFTSILSYLETSYLNIILSFFIAIIGIYLLVIPYKNLVNWTKEGKELKTEYELFKNYYNNELKTSNNSKEFLEEGIKQLPYLVGVGISKATLVNNFSESKDTTDTYLFLKYNTDSLIKEIVKEFLAADGSFDPKYYNNSGNFVPGFGL